MSNKNNVKYIESIVEGVFKKHFGDIGLASARTKKKIYEETLGGIRLDRKIYIYSGQEKEPDFRKASLSNLKKIIRKKKKFSFFADIRNGEYLASGKDLRLGKMESALLFHFLKDYPPSRTTPREIYCGVWQPGDPGNVKDNYKKSVEELLVRLRRKVERVTKRKGTDVIKYWMNPKSVESTFGLNPDISYCVIFD